MVFNSLHFLIFFPIVTLLYFMLPHRFRWLHLLIASCVFYMAFIPVYILILAGTILIDYVAGILIEPAVGWKRRLLLLASIAANVGILFVFKYFNFFTGNLNALTAYIGGEPLLRGLEIVLPLGLSFHTFQAMSYTIEVYRGNQSAERHLGIYALYVMFYPQLVAGPIERPQNLLYQFREVHAFEYGEAVDGLKLMLFGLFKKMVIADRLAVAVNAVYNHPTEFQGWSLWVATLCFAFQIYCDFSGYSDIALGAAQVMGFRLMKNFDSPYLSASVGEFWQRWHISLSTWFRDYLYIPLGGNRVSLPRWTLNVMVVFLVSGLWHGSAWTYVIWGALHGAYLICETATRGIRSRFATLIGLDRFPQLARVFGVAVTFLLVCFAWIFFRANSFTDAQWIVSHLFSGLSWPSAKTMAPLLASVHLTATDLFIAMSGLIVLELLNLAGRGHRIRRPLGYAPAWLQWAVCLGLTLAIMNLGVVSETLFIYFQF